MHLGAGRLTLAVDEPNHPDADRLTGLASGALAGYGPLHAAHADLLDQVVEAEAAAAAWERAIAATPNDALRAELRRRVRPDSPPASA